jgi:hypothetical protein
MKKQHFNNDIIISTFVKQCWCHFCTITLHLFAPLLFNNIFFSPFFSFSFISFYVFICIWSFMFRCNYVLIFYSFVFLFIHLHLVLFIHVYYVSSSCLFFYISSFCSFMSLWLLTIYASSIVISSCSYANLGLHYFLYFIIFYVVCLLTCAFNIDEVSIVEYLPSTSNIRISYSLYIHKILDIWLVVMDHCRICNIHGPQFMVLHYVYMLQLVTLIVMQYRFFWHC